MAATYWLGRMLLANRRVALLAAALLAVSFWHILFSRLGFRAIGQPLLQALTVGALFAGLRKSTWRPSLPWLILAGAALGLTAYTYLAARFFPIALLVGLLPLLLGSDAVRLRLKQLALFVFIGFIPNTDLIKDPVEKDEGGFIITNQNMETNIPGLFVAGDCRSQLIRQITNACGDATTAAVAAEKYLEAQEEAKKSSAATASP